MNIVLLRSDDWIGGNTVALHDRRAHHIRTILAARPGDHIRVGKLNGDCGVGLITDLDDRQIRLDVTLNQPPPARHPHDLVLALPRPKMLRRVLRTVAEFGVDNLHLIHSYRVEKSYWQSPLLSADRIEEALVAGLERAADTRLPTVHLHHRFRPFVEDELPTLCRQRDCLVAHPGSPVPISAQQRAAVIMIGPEGGFIPFEIELAQAQGACLGHLGCRTLSVDTAVNAALGCTAA